MAVRTSAPAVEALIEVESGVSLTVYIAMGNSLTDWLDSKDTDGLLSDATLELIERNLAAHFYQASRDRNYTSKQNQSASGSFQGKTDMGLLSTDPGHAAIILDITGNLAAHNKQVIEGKNKSIGLVWLGTATDSERPDEDFTE